MKPLRVAMWSGPRNISTAMMRSWENRGDTWVWDEPLYAHYLQHTGLAHPMKQDVIDQGESDWRKVIDQMMEKIPRGKSIFFQKHMTHHLLGHIDRSWMADVTNFFLIRDPYEVVASYAQKRETVEAADIGIEQQGEIFDYVTELTGTVPPVVDARDVLIDPKEVLSGLCTRIGIPFTNRMLSWPVGARSSDGVWGKHWYNSVETSTGFSSYQEKGVQLPGELEKIAEQLLPHYQRMYQHRTKY